MNIQNMPYKIRRQIVKGQIAQYVAMVAEIQDIPKENLSIILEELSKELKENE